MVPCLIPDTPGDLGCGPGLGCLFDCTEAEPPVEPATCISGCYAQLTAEAQSELVGFGGCIAEPDPLTFEECFTLGVACVGASGDGITNCVDTLTCFETKMMSQVTPAGGPLFIFECLGEASEQAAQEATDAFLCMISSQADESSQMGGFPCSDELVTCANPSGDGGCADLMACLMEECEDEEGPASMGGLGCMASCLSQSSPEGVNQYFSMSSCYPDCASNCGAGENTPPDEACFSKCYEETCAPLFEKCMPGGGGF